MPTTKTKTKPKLATLALMAICCEALDDKKALDLKILDVRGVSTVTDYLIIASGNSQPHLKALRGSVERALKNAKAHIIGAESGEASGWQVVDAFDFMVHLFTPEMRENYRLEQLWKDATIIEPADLKPA
ncbi:ribosome silencing factor [Cerasicoccus arenae]|uniref:Ribosomal silencing factor RsfS n=1 Tax=Cerasicoccus arenae TaxID=424488 RepID=A0A8J3GCS0_9BACT|nr:ribosome silencing factor [Cerasicoccus arenae]MBK1858286.1 ribosome silencing factor [Cerasicoccus arenae]GHB90538.1 ribosomal silencing factor RsfS [Cerasicoccus arenae]